MDVTSALFTPTMFDDPYPVYARLRAEAPVLFVPQFRMWLVSRHDDVHHVLRSVDAFSSVNTSVDHVRDPRLREGVEQLSRAIIYLDPPDHTRLRKLINVAFTPRAVARLEGRIRALARGYIDAIQRAPSFDLMEALANPLPVIVIAEMLGVDPARHADFKRWSDDLVIGLRIDPAKVDRVVQSRREFTAFLRDMIAQRRREPQDDLVSDLVRAEAERDVLSPDEVLTMVMFLMVAGNETTTNLVGNATAALLDHPAELQRLRADPSLIPGFLEESLRYRSPVSMAAARTTTREVELGGVTLPRGAIVGALIDSAHHDPTRFPEPERFDITRNPAHLAFGFGIHYCVGAPLSRLEARIVFEEMLARLPAFEREPGPLDWHRTFMLRGLKTLRLRFTAPASADAPVAAG
jgi:cytochrome P450